MTVALLTVRGNYAVDALVACARSSQLPSVNGLALTSLDVGALNLDFKLPTAFTYNLPGTAEGETVLLDTAWLTRIAETSSNAPLQVLETLSQRFQKLVLLDNSSPFQIQLPNIWMDVADTIIKVNGVYHDHELYNYVVGAPTPDGRWTQKTERVTEAISASNLQKLYLGLPCTIGIVPRIRQKARRFYCDSAGARALRDAIDKVLETFAVFENSSPTPAKLRKTVNFVGSLTHVQRWDALRLLGQSRLQWQGGITGIPEWITGWQGLQMAQVSAEERHHLKEQLQIEGLLTPPQNRVRYNAAMRECKAVLSITGYGEMCFRMAEAWAARRVLVCQDVSHARTLFPIRNGRNAIYCKPDLSDLIDILDDIECNYSHYAPIAHQGYEDWRAWCRCASETIKEGFVPLASSSPMLAPA